MSSQPTVSIAGDELGARPRSYGDLQGLAARYAQARLDNRAVVNRATQQPILLDWRRGLKRAVAPGTAPELLLALPALPALLANAQYLGAVDVPNRRSDVGQLYRFRATADVIGRPIALWLYARRVRPGHLVFDRLVARVPVIAPREDGGTLPDAPGARTQALHAVLARAYLPPRRQDGGGTNGTDETASTGPDASGAAPDTSATQSAVGPSTGSGDGPSGTSANSQLALRGDECDEQLYDDIQFCQSLPNETKEDSYIRRMCWHNAHERHAACIRGRRGEDLPPLVTWRKPTPAPSQGTGALPPLILPSPSGGGSGGLPSLVPRVPNY